MNESPNGANVKKPRDWLAIRHEYETTKIGQRKLADKMGISRSTLMQRAMRENWSQRGKLVHKAALELEAELDEKAVAIVRDELAPFIEAEKVKITKRGYKLGARGMKRIEELFRKFKPTEAKVEADSARAAEIFLRMARTSLGMNDGSAAGGPLTLQILGNQQAIQIAPDKSA